MNFACKRKWKRSDSDTQSYDKIPYTNGNKHIDNTTRVSVETGSSTGLFLFIYVQTF